MTTDLIPPSKSLGYSDIYLDFVAGNDPPKHLYYAESLEAVAKQLDAVDYRRERLVEIVKNQNSICSAPEETFRNIEKLKDPRAVCLFAGQQAGLFGGPMFTIIKAVAVVKAAALYEKQLGRPVVPMFWVAGDDHDFEEVNHMFVLDRETEIQKISYATPPPQEDSVADVQFADADELERAKSQLKEILGETDFTPALYELLDASYTSKDTFATAFGKFMTGLMKGTGLVLFCPGFEEVKKLAVPFFKTIIDKQEELHRRISAANDEINRLGYHIQVEKKENASHLFYNIDGRKPVMRDNGGFTVGEKRFTREELDKAIEEHPEQFSPDVMTRPVFQSYLFPTVSQKGGPAEIAYLAQVNPIFEVFGLPAPYYKARPTVTIIEKRFEKIMKQYEISFEELTGDIEQVINRVLSKSFPDSIEASSHKLKEDVEKRFEQFMKESLEFDPSLRKFGKQIFGKIDYNLKQFESKIFSSHKKKSQDTRDRMYRVWHALYPERGFQERTLNVTYFISKYGFDFVSFLSQTMDSEEKAHQLLHLSEMTT